MGLQRQDDVVLHAELGGVVGGRDVDRRLRVAGEKTEAVGADRLEVGPARDQACLGGAGGRELGGDQSADGAGAEDADLHEDSPSFSARPIRCSLPVAPLGISSMKMIFAGTLKSASRVAANSRSSRSAAAIALAEHHRRADLLAERAVGNGEGHHLRHGRVIHQHLVDLARRDLFAAAIDDLLEAAR